MTTINHINAGLIITSTQLMGGAIDTALSMARFGRLESDLNSRPHRATVVRLVKSGWARMEREAREAAERAASQAAYNLDCRARNPEAWDAAAAIENGKKRREALRKLKRAYDAGRADSRQKS